MGTKVCLLLILLHCAMTESTIIYPPCLNATVAPNQMKCFSWSYNETSNECNLVQGAIINLFPGTDFIYAPGYFTGGYANTYFCKWRIAPISSCHRTGFYLLKKLLHDSNPSSGTNCPVKDHIHLAHSVNQNNFYCGGESANNCPVDNCPRGFQDSSGETYVTFRSDATGTASGFMGLTVDNIEISGCDRRRRSVEKMAVKKTPKCRKLSKKKRKKTCECSGTCTVSPEVSKEDPDELRRVINDIISDPLEALKNAYKYVNSDNQILLGVARRVVENIELFGVPVPTIAQRLEYTSFGFKLCQVSLIKAKSKIKSLFKIVPTTSEIPTEVEVPTDIEVDFKPRKPKFG